MNSLDKHYQALLQDILDSGVEKKDRTGTGTFSVFGRQIRHKMSDGFPLLTTKKVHFKGVIAELLWFLRGETNIKSLLAYGCNIWNGDAYKNYSSKVEAWEPHLDEDMFIERIKTNDEFAEKWGDLGPIYGKQWRSWNKYDHQAIDKNSFPNVKTSVDQIANLISELKSNPDSRRLMVNAWNVADLPVTDYRTDDELYQDYLKDNNKYGRKHITEGKMVLPPCHFSFQCYSHEKDGKRYLSLAWNQRSVDTFLGLPFNIASYGLLLEIIAREVNMVPDELIGNLGDVHLYLNHVEQAKEQIGRTPYELPKLVIEYSSLNPVELASKLEDYQSHPAIKAPLSN